MSLQERGDRCSSLMFAACLESIRARQGRTGGPRVVEAEGLHHVVVTELGAFWLLLNSDGIGTKIEVAERVGRYDTVAWDLLAMLCDDAVRFGAQPLSGSNVLDCTRAEATVAEGLARGLAEAAVAAEVAMVGGEVAELGPRVGGAAPEGGYNWAGTVLSVIRPDRLLTGSALAAGQSLVALRERGFRSNGFTLARRTLSAAYGPAWHKEPFEERTWGDALLERSKIYAPAMLDAVGRFDSEPVISVTGVVHVTGGGIPAKLARLLRGRGLSARLEGLWDPATSMLELQRMGKISDREAYQTWNMGNGMLVVTPEPDRLIEILGRRGVEARVAGMLEAGKGITLASCGAGGSRERLSFEVDES